MPEVNITPAKVEDNQWRDAQFRFDGRWIPDVDGALIGPNNYQLLENLRYKDSGLEGVNGYAKVNTTALTTYTNITTGHQLRTSKTQDSYVLVHATDSSDQGRVFVNRTAPGSQGDFDSTNRLDTSGNAYFEDASVDLQGRFSDAPQGNIGYANSEESMIFGGDEQRVAAAFQVDDASLTNPIDVTERVNNELDTTTNRFTIDKSGKEFALVMTTRPIQALKIYVSSTNLNTTSSTLTVKTWTGAAFSADLVDTDGTSSGGISLAQTGIVKLTNHQYDSSVVQHFEELYLYSYLIELSAGDADLYHITADFAFQPVGDVWDGVYRQPIQFQVLDDTVYYDYTLQVNESSDVNAPIGGEIGSSGTSANDKVYIMFEDQASAIRFTLLANRVNSIASTMTMKYWDGSAYAALTITDGTIGEATKSCSQSGSITWTPPTDEVPRQLFGSFGYVYEIDFSAGLSATVTVDVCTGVPAQLTVLPFDFPAIYGTRLMLGGYSKGDEGNRMDYSVANAPDAFNGFDSSDNGKQSLYFGGVESIVGATQIYNRFGASIFAMLLVLKKNETYIVVGDTPEDFIIYDVAKTVGCVAPLSLATAEIGLDLGQGITRNVAIWLSHSGPVMFDGAILSPIPGIRSYFDPNDAKYIEFDVISKAKGWVDPNYKEYNLLIPSGAAAENNVWLVYDLIRRKWFTKNTGQAQFPQSGFEVGEPDTGQRLIYSGIDGHMINLETGTYWDDGTSEGITQKVKTGDFFPSSNLWDETLIRKFKIFIKKLTNSTQDNVLSITYYTNTEVNPGSGVIYEDSNAAAGIDVDWQDVTEGVEAAGDGVSWESAVSALVDLNLDVGLQRLIRVVQDLNRRGWAHAFEFSVTTTDVTKGFQPVAWGIRYRIERKDDTATS